MLRPPFPGHRRYSITHRAVQRLRELVPNREEEDDETLRDKLDAALGTAETEGRAVRTLDAMLGEPQTLIPVTDFGDVLYAIVKEDTVVTVLPKGHGEEILQRGQAMEQRVATLGGVRAVESDVAAGGPQGGAAPDDKWERRRWRPREAPPLVIERARSSNGAGHGSPDIAVEHGDAGELSTLPAAATVVPLPDRPSMAGPVGEALREAMEKGRRKAAIAALREVFGASGRDEPLLPLWNELARHDIPQCLTIGDLIDAVRGVSEE